MQTKFTTTIHPIFNVHSCVAKLAEESRGVMGCHLFTSCPDCRVEPAGFEGWGENGHRQFAGPDPSAFREIRTKRGETVRDDGRPIYYRA